MDINETTPILCMCRLCLNYSSDCTEIDDDESYTSIRNQIKKYLQFEINNIDTLPRTVCHHCINRIQIFDQFCCEVIQHQHLLQLSKLRQVNNKPQIVATPADLIQLSPTIVSKGNGTLIITLQTTSASSALQSNDEFESATNAEYAIVGEVNDNCEEIVKEPSNTSTHLNSFSLERELDDLAAEDITAEVQGESDNDDGYNEDGDDSTNTVDDIGINRNQYKDFPAKIIDDCKLLYKGRDLLDMISRFYRMECDQCHDTPERAVFDSLSDLCRHYVDCHQMKGYVVCCNMKLIKPRAMALHMARHLNPHAFRCPECNKMLTCPKILQYHIQNHRPESERPLACPQCPRRFSYSSALVAHTISHQPEDQRAAHVCDECGKVFASAGRLTTHINVTHMRHGQDYICQICGKKFACRTNLNYHLTTHQPKVRQVQCEKCEKWLKNKLCLRKHMVQHSSVRYSCTICDYSALNRQCLRNHMRVQHTTDKPFGCDVCGKTFKLKNTLINHTVQHTGIRKFKCNFCSRSFASSGNFYSHRKRMHPQELAAMKLKQEEDERY